jgi:hypothetical protein
MVSDFSGSRNVGVGDGLSSFARLLPGLERTGDRGGAAIGVNSSGSLALQGTPCDATAP